MTIWRLIILGHELLRVERVQDADKTLGQALSELIEPDDDDEVESDQSFFRDGREAGDDEHLIFLGLDGVHDHVGEEDLD